MFSNAIFWCVREKWTMDVVAFKPSSRTFQLQLSCWSSCSWETKIIAEYHWASPSRDRRNGEVICKSRHRRSNSKFMLPLSFEVETFRIRGFCAVLNLDFFVLSSAQTSFALSLRFWASTSKRSEVETECSEVFDAGTRMRKVLGCRVSLSPEAREEQRADREPIWTEHRKTPISNLTNPTDQMSVLQKDRSKLVRLCCFQRQSTSQVGSVRLHRGSCLYMGLVRSF